MAQEGYDENDSGTDRRRGNELILFQLGELAKGQIKLEATLDRGMAELRKSMTDLDHSLGDRVGKLEIWQAGVVARDDAVKEKSGDRGAEVVKLAVLALTCLAVVLYLLAQRL